MQRTHIEWSDRSWNPVRFHERATGKTVWHCEKVSAGCDHCYAEALARRFKRGGRFAKQDRGLYEVFVDEKELSAPLRLRTPQRIFVADMTDLFGEWVPDEMIDRVFAVMALSPQHTFQVLTKRAERMLAYTRSSALAERVVAKAYTYVSGNPGDEYAHHKSFEATRIDRFLSKLKCISFPLANVWLGVSAEDQQRANERIPHLLQTPAAVLWVSYEPAIGPIDFNRITSACLPSLRQTAQYTPWIEFVDWVVVGGESGAGARPFNLQWARDTISQCREAGVACFVKQLGANAVGVGQETTCTVNGIEHSGRIGGLVDAKGGDPSEWPSDLRIRQYPEVSG